MPVSIAMIMRTCLPAGKNKHFPLSLLLLCIYRVDICQILASLYICIYFLSTLSANVCLLIEIAKAASGSVQDIGHLWTIRASLWDINQKNRTIKRFFKYK